MPNGNILGKLLPGGGPAALNLWLKSGGTNEGGGVGIVGNGSKKKINSLSLLVSALIKDLTASTIDFLNVKTIKLLNSCQEFGISYL